jgi:hypothetical protein
VTRQTKIRPELKKVSLRLIVEDYLVIKDRGEHWHLWCEEVEFWQRESHLELESMEWIKQNEVEKRSVNLEVLLLTIKSGFSIFSAGSCSEMEAWPGRFRDGLALSGGRGANEVVEQISRKGTEAEWRAVGRHAG